MWRHRWKDGTVRRVEVAAHDIAYAGRSARLVLALDRIVVVAIARREPIAVFGDYDCDGITATAIMTTILRQLGGEVTPLLNQALVGLPYLRSLAVIDAQGRACLRQRT